MSEWLKELVLKTSEPARARGFESYHLRFKSTVIVRIAVLFYLWYDERRAEAEGLSALPDGDW